MPGAASAGRSRVVGRKEPVPSLFRNPSPFLRNPLDAQKGLCGHTAQETDDLGLYDLDLSLAVSAETRFLLRSLGCPVIRRTAFHDTGDEKDVPRKPGLSEDFVQNLSRAAHKRPSLKVLFTARRLSDEHDGRIRGTLSGHRLLTVFVKPAAFAAGNFLSDLIQCYNLFSLLSSHPSSPGTAQPFLQSI
jgi:hypothetical protein